jgi:hypothetical protein
MTEILRSCASTCSVSIANGRNSSFTGSAARSRPDTLLEVERLDDITVFAI